MEKENLYQTENESLVSDIAYKPQIEYEFKYCKFCNEKLNKELNFCTKCGKNQNGEDISFAPAKKIKIKKKKKKTLNKKLIVGIFAYLFFAFALTFFIAGFICMMFNNNTTTISIFGSNSDGLIKNISYVTGNLLMSLICLITGIFLDFKKGK